MRVRRLGAGALTQGRPCVPVVCCRRHSCGRAHCRAFSWYSSASPFIQQLRVIGQGGGAAGVTYFARPPVTTSVAGLPGSSVLPAVNEHGGAQHQPDSIQLSVLVPMAFQGSPDAPAAAGLATRSARSRWKGRGRCSKTAPRRPDQPPPTLKVVACKISVMTGSGKFAAA